MIQKIMKYKMGNKVSDEFFYKVMWFVMKQRYVDKNEIGLPK